MTHCVVVLVVVVIAVHSIGVCVMSRCIHMHSVHIIAILRIVSIPRHGRRVATIVATVSVAVVDISVVIAHCVVIVVVIVIVLVIVIEIALRIDRRYGFAHGSALRSVRILFVHVIAAAVCHRFDIGFPFVLSLAGFAFASDFLFVSFLKLFQSVFGFVIVRCQGGLANFSRVAEMLDLNATFLHHHALIGRIEPEKEFTILRHGRGTGKINRIRGVRVGVIAVSALLFAVKLKRGVLGIKGYMASSRFIH